VHLAIILESLWVAYVAKKNSRSPLDFWPIQLCAYIDFRLEKNKKIFRSSKIKNGTKVDQK
jgi:hypothetical protein